jgi:DNA-binding NtrC family response regulator
LSGRPLLRRLRLVVVEGADVGVAVPLDRGTILIGTRADVDLRLTDRRVSRVHVEAVRTDDGVRIRDAGSRNGVIVGDAKVSDARLPAGARFTVGASVIAVQAEDAPVQLKDGPANFGGLFAVSPKMRHLHAILQRAAASDVTILLEGETGTGKEVISRAIHDESRRSARPFLVVDCGAMSRELLGSELFGHRRGAFTGAVSDRQGLFEAAAGGTVLLDEIGEMPVDLQPALLRVLETRQVRRLGESSARNIDVRIIAATHRDLADMVRRGAFREDLFFRLAVVRLKIPALRDRLDDLPLLLDRILGKLGTSLRPNANDVAALRRHRWPGNVRELRNVVEQAVALSGDTFEIPAFDDDGGDPHLSPTIHRPDGHDGHDRPDRPDRSVQALFGSPARDDDGGLAVADLMGLPFSEARDQALLRFERLFMEVALSKAAGNVSRAAEAVGLTRTYAHRVLRRAGLRGDDDVSPQGTRHPGKGAR